MKEEKISVVDLRIEYKKGTLDEHEVELSPFDQFNKWFKEAISSEIPEVNAMTLATATKHGRPSARTVLLKQYDDKGFVFFTNYGSKKAKDLTDNPQAALLLFWEPLERQIRIVGSVEKVSAAESFEYFRTRPIDSQLGAWASQQSTEISARALLEKAFGEMMEKFKNGQIPLPPFWGGYRVIPDEFEFWQGRASRLHDRVAYQKQSNHNWKIVRLSP
ncbi:MAG: pyridoxamine 5'-phosphate oxidase [Ignavibacteriales bacterium]|nr:pyridoxamine 5'-phosphate oxidase [Ignavibacteriales bacterium]